MSYKEIKIQTKVLIISICIVVLTIIGTSYAAFVWNDTGSNQTVSSGNYTIEIENTSGTTINLGNAYPMSDEEGKATTPYKFTIKNNSNTDVEFSLKLVDDASKTNDINKKDVKIHLTGDGKIDNGSIYMLSNGEIDAGILRANSSKSYELRIWIKEDATNDTIGKQYNGKLTLDTKQIEQTGVTYDKGDVNMNGVIDLHDFYTVYNIVAGYYNDASTIQKELADVQTDGNMTTSDYVLVYSLIPNVNNNLQTKLFYSKTTANGVYNTVGEGLKTKNGLPVYYFKGNVENNYVQFGTYKTSDGGNTIGQPILWRAIRMNEDGSLRLISDNSIAVTTWSNSSNRSYIYQDSNVKNVIDKWYEDNIGSDNNLDSKVYNSYFCNDIGLDKSNYLEDNSVAYERIVEYSQPQFRCIDEYRFESKVALISSDEAFYAGVTNDSANSYLINGDEQYEMLTLTARSIAPAIFGYSDSGFAEHHLYYDTSIVKSVINLRPDVTISGGTGTSTDPYIIK